MRAGICQGSPGKGPEGGFYTVWFLFRHRSHQPQAFCKEAVIWKRLKHPNVLALLGVNTSLGLQLISDWMPNGDLPEYIEEHADADRLELVGATPITITPN